MGKNFVFVDDLSPQDIEADVASQTVRLRREAGTTPLATSDKVLVRQGGDLVEVPVSEFNGSPPATVFEKVFNVAQGTVMSFDNLKLTLSGNNCQISTAVGAENVAILSEHEYPGGSFASHTGGVGTSVSVTTTPQNVGYTGFVTGERATLTIANFTTSKLYLACVWMHSQAGGNWSGWVEEI